MRSFSCTNKPWRSKSIYLLFISGCLERVCLWRVRQIRRIITISLKDNYLAWKTRRLFIKTDVLMVISESPKAESKQRWQPIGFLDRKQSSNNLGNRFKTFIIVQWMVCSCALCCNVETAWTIQRKFKVFERQFDSWFQYLLHSSLLVILSETCCWTSCLHSIKPLKYCLSWLVIRVNADK